MTDVKKTASQRAIQKTAEATSELIGNKTADKITSVSKKSSQNNFDETKNETNTKRNIYLQKKDNKLLMD